ncbi:hypothetical protein EYC84_004587 [Monilinia fructicola]|uniref:Uncharacterized protein n=1 Tax=Monilinia fructicola TaxID=38448 RepID=A0A5M9K1M2_MONFR|nr:hypothetical protein EYC84_004587 [Monilinia fructicola]
MFPLLVAITRIPSYQKGELINNSAIEMPYQVHCMYDGLADCLCVLYLISIVGPLPSPLIFKRQCRQQPNTDDIENSENRLLLNTRYKALNSLKPLNPRNSWRAICKLAIKS